MVQWSSRFSRSWVKLDRVLTNSIFVSKFGDDVGRFLNRRTSYHSPILFQLVSACKRYGHAPFRFQNMWTTHDSFLASVKDSWNGSMVAENGLMNLTGKLKTVKLALRVWNKPVFGRVDGHSNALKEKIEVLEESLQMNYSESVET